MDLTIVDLPTTRCPTLSIPRRLFPCRLLGKFHVIGEACGTVVSSADGAELFTSQFGQVYLNNAIGAQVKANPWSLSAFRSESGIVFMLGHLPQLLI